VGEIVGEEEACLIVSTHHWSGQGIHFFIFYFHPRYFRNGGGIKRKTLKYYAGFGPFLFSFFFSSEILLKESVPVAMEGIALFQHYRKIGY